MAEHNETGKWGEKVARDYLLAQGYAIMGENVRIGNMEIDIIAMKDSSICFVEVKTRSTDFK
ncbi:MAG: YraN family protein, partial [Duncaniella sp.]|nr:YraN family protein [Duncaniella sp.]